MCIFPNSALPKAEEWSTFPETTAEEIGFSPNDGMKSGAKENGFSRNKCPLFPRQIKLIRRPNIGNLIYMLNTFISHNPGGGVFTHRSHCLDPVSICCQSARTRESETFHRPSQSKSLSTRQDSTPLSCFSLLLSISAPKKSQLSQPAGLPQSHSSAD